MAKSIYDYRDAEGFLPEERFDEWCHKHNLRRELSNTPRFDGIYASEVKDHDVIEEYAYTLKIPIRTSTYHSQTYLRFYLDGTVLYEHADERFLPSPERMAVVFKRESKEVKSRGVYKLRGGQIAVEVIEVGPKPALLLSGPKTRHSFLGLYLNEGLNRGTLYRVMRLGGVEKYEFTFVKAYQEELQLQALRTLPPSVAAPMQTHPLSPSAQQAVSQLEDEGQRYLNASSYALALPIYEQIIRIDPTNDYAHFYKGVCLSALGSHDLALAAYEQACRLKPLNALYHSSRGDELIDLQRLQEALEVYQQCLQIEPQLGLYANMQAWEGISKALEKLGRTREAQEAQQYYQQSYQLYVGGGKLQLQTPASSAPMQTLPSSTFARQPVTHMPYKPGITIVTYQQPGSKVDGLARSPDGRRIASFGLGEAQVWDPLSGNVLYDYKVKGFATIITALAWSPDSTRVATAGSDKVVQIWDANDGHIITAHKGHHKFIRCLSWSPNGQHIASCEDTELQIWNALSGQDIFTFTAHPKTLVGMRCLAWSPDATRIATGGGDNHVTVWNPGSGNPIYTYTQQHNTINGLAWSPDGKRIASGSSDKTVHIWAAETGADQVVCQGHTKAVNAVAFSPDGKLIASASDDTTVRIWSSETGQLLFTYEGHKKGVKALAWSPDGKYIASGGDERIVQVWTSGIP